MNPNASISTHQFQCITFSNCNIYILVTHIETQCNCIFCESGFLVILIAPRIFIFIWKSAYSGHTDWGPVQLYFLRIRISGNLDCPPGISFSYKNIYIKATHIEAQCNCIFCESGFLVILITHPDFFFSYGNLYILATDTDAECNCMFCKSGFLVILIHSPRSFMFIWKSL